MIKNFQGKEPKIHKTCYISESVDIIGEVVIGENSNIWFGTRARGDMNKISIGENTNIQENSVVHVDTDFPTIIGDNVTVGHGAIIHGCEISDNVLIGMGSIILNGAKISKNTIVAAGSLVSQGKTFKEGVLLMGSPAKVVRDLTKEEINSIQTSANNYVALSKKYL
ncbi:gamma carbonic anhydrase family protein [Clostridium septicum]|uniref:Gamma carbonic anhydrase family protein n=1 Tax=Clostridium septicum TaxID=1504 RepID=A0A9N7JJL5_CLOSE|nr:gamma carbonic anhydrase family protein [Clostridium septicum]AYE33305.1 gamma carbonic anhydrase family protein [Clostridium septicum]MDU1314459.1 gamma carbonic anhydrase family protein [Clostridium septicum]QAS61475.1 gamma carbonic anhydrase family protein [Clostridium septicum]UEC22089.1 gamma carbonic anhydrase family protein [Clostridium septicum]USR99879.1 gamma carbonic anhydrase family protein [Clostridium septicum]